MALNAFNFAKNSGEDVEGSGSEPTYRADNGQHNDKRINQFGVELHQARLVHRPRDADLGPGVFGAEHGDEGGAIDAFIEHELRVGLEHLADVGNSGSHFNWRPPPDSAGRQIAEGLGYHRCFRHRLRLRC